MIENTAKNYYYEWYPAPALMESVVSLCFDLLVNGPLSRQPRMAVCGGRDPEDALPRLSWWRLRLPGRARDIDYGYRR